MSVGWSRITKKFWLHTVELMKKSVYRKTALSRLVLVVVARKMARFFSARLELNSFFYSSGD
jgi:hypothetical protein